MSITQQAFDELPALVPLRTFMQFSGLPRQTIEAMRVEGNLKAYRPPGHRKVRYLKSDLARVCGFVLR